MVKKDNKYFQGYNCQTAATDNGLIIAAEAENCSADQVYSQFMIEKTNDILNKLEISENQIKNIKYLMDKGYHNSNMIGSLIRNGYDIYIPNQEKTDIENCKKISTDQCKLTKTATECILECPGGQKLKKQFLIIL